MRASVAFPMIGGAHQLFHTAPVAALLSIISPETEVVILAPDMRSLALIQSAVSLYPGSSVRVELLKRSWIGGLIAGVTRRRSSTKGPLLWRNRKLFNRFDALVLAECTSLLLRNMGVRRPVFLCIPHGAGDRAISFEPRFRNFDAVLVAGEKTVRRMVASGVDPSRLKIVGYPKADFVRRLRTEAERLFTNDRPTILYSPHFRRKLSSLDNGLAIASEFARHEGFNLIVAPHVRAFEDSSAKERQAWQSLAIPDKVIVDLGSERLFDMTYVDAADIFLGDVSSQVYEFLLRPRPCVFLNAHGVDWVGNDDYAFWNLGEVVHPKDAIPAIERAQHRHSEFLSQQRAAVAETFGGLTNAAEIAAQEILVSIGMRTPNPIQVSSPAELPRRDAKGLAGNTGLPQRGRI